MADSEIAEALRKGIRAARRKDRAAARQWLRRVVEADPNREDAWLWLARVVDDPAERRQALERALALNPDNRWAAQQLETLDAQPPPPAAPAAPSGAVPAPPRPSKPRLETLQCPSCGGTIEIRNQEGAKTVVCRYCGSVLDLTPEQAAIVGRSDLKIRPMKPIEPGMKATFGGTAYEVTGWMRYKGFDDEDLWMWDEWLLLGENGSVRWLSYDPEEGFLLQDRAPITASFDPSTAHRIPVPGGEADVIERAQAELVVLRGELTWRATVGDQIRYLEARHGATRYSVEFSTQELELAAGHRLSEQAVWTAFGRDELAAEIQAESQQEAALKRLRNVSVLLAGLALLLFGIAGCSGSEQFQAQTGLQGDGAAKIIGTAELAAGSVQRIRLACAEPPLNAWSLISAWAYDAKNTKYLLGSLNCWHESGRDEDGYWEERQVEAKHIFKPATPGPYRFEVVLEEASYGPVNVNVQVDTGVWHRPPFFVAFLLFIGLAWLLHRWARKT